MILELLKSVIFGIVEGITEWLPISSTGHLILVEQFLKFNQVSSGFWDMFQVVIQFGAILAVVLLYFKDIWPFTKNKEKAIKKTGLKTIALAGGVSANSYIRNAFKELEKDGIKVYMPDLKLCTDNAAMIASAGYYNYINGKRDDLALNAIPNLKL